MIRNEKGIALIFVLWVLVFLSVIAAAFGRSVRQISRAAFSEGMRIRAEYISLAGLQKALTEYIQDEIRSNPKRWRVNAANPAQEILGGEFKVFIDNASGKINLNEADRDLIRLLLNKSELSDSEKDVIVDSILDWRDEDHLARLNGAEKDYYEGLASPYACRNGDFVSTGELLKVRGMTPHLFDTCFRDLISVKSDENELLPKRSEIQDYLRLENRQESKGIQTFLTLEKRDKMNRVGKLYDYGKINLNAASQRILGCLPGMTDELVAKVTEYRAEKDFLSLSEVESLVGKSVFDNFRQYVNLSLSRYYTVICRARVRGSEVVRQLKWDIWLDIENYQGYKVLQRY